jgi:hypothetical protein
MTGKILWLGALGAVAMLSACVEEPTPKEAEKAVQVVNQDEVKAHKMSIEEAAEEATKLVEADAKAEIDAMGADEAK